jgi:hypothetical protein
MRGLLSPSEPTPAAQPDDAHSVLRLNYETLKGLISLASPTVAKFTHSETGEGGSRRMIESRPSIFGTHDGDGML